MNVAFSVPAYPQFRPGLAGEEYRKHEVYLRRFENYACTSLKLQMEATLAAAKEFAQGSMKDVLELELLKIKGLTEDFAAAACGVAERAAGAVDSNMSVAANGIEVAVKAAVAGLVGDVKIAVEDTVGDCLSGIDGQSGCGVESLGTNVSEKTLVNRRKRHARAAARRRRKGELTCDCVDRDVCGDVRDVPEWRRKGAVALEHKGAFADCSAQVQAELRETRARMLVERNKAAAVSAEHQRRVVQARLQARMAENEVECSRLKLDAENEKLMIKKAEGLAPGFAETVLSLGVEAVFENGSCSTASVSPDSSVSVAELRQKDRAISVLVGQLAEYELAASAAKRKDEEEKKKKEKKNFERKSSAGVKTTGDGAAY